MSTKSSMLGSHVWLDCGADQVALWLHDRMFKSLQLS